MFGPRMAELPLLTNSIVNDLAQYGNRRHLVSTRPLNNTKQLIGIVAAAFSILTLLATGCSKEPTPAPSAPKSSWGSSQEKKMTGIYQSVTPPYVLQLAYGGRTAMENLESGGRYSGKWSAQDGVLVTIWDSNRSKTTYDINSDGSFKSSHGILFVKTQ